MAGEVVTYAEMATMAGTLAAVLQQGTRPRPVLGAVFASRSTTAYAAVLGTLLSGAGYVPLNPKFPARRNAFMLDVSNATTLIVGEECIEQLPSVLEGISRTLTIVLPTQRDVSELAAQFSAHRFVNAREIEATSPITEAPAVDPAELAYLLFTSGSTGQPKGVMVSHANVLALLDAMWERYSIRPDDRFSQTFDLTFDLSVFDMFVCWGRGAALYSIPSSALMLPDDFIRDHALTVWFSVPSVGMMLARMRRLRPDAFPTLRWSLFCGERLPADVAASWQRAAPSSTVENLYGPTEATVACTLYRWTEDSASWCVDGTVPIGRPYPGMSAAIVDDRLGLQPAGTTGELCVKGPQVTHGYWRDPAKTNDRFVAMPWYDGPDNRWYRTGDLAYVDAHGELIHCGRNDDQIKMRGFRIELPEIEAALRDAAGSPFSAVLPYPRDEHAILGLTAVVAAAASDEATILSRLQSMLPDYMVPGRIVLMAEMPLNANGKIDRVALIEHLRKEYDA